MRQHQSLYMAALLAVFASIGCDGTDTGEASCAFPGGCSFRARATTPDGWRYRGLLSYARSINAIVLEAGEVYESDHQCVNADGGLDIWFPLLGTTSVVKDASGDLHATWTRSGPDERAPLVYGENRTSVLAMDLTLSPDGHLRATLTVDGWPGVNASSNDAAAGGIDGGTDAGAVGPQTVTVEGPLDFSPNLYSSDSCTGDTASLPLSNGTSMTFPCNATWSDPTVVVTPAKPCLDEI
jgi:hypothetical protein